MSAETSLAFEISANYELLEVRNLQKFQRPASAIFAHLKLVFLFNMKIKGKTFLNRKKMKFDIDNLAVRTEDWGTLYKINKNLKKSILTEVPSHSAIKTFYFPAAFSYKKLWLFLFSFSKSSKIIKKLNRQMLFLAHLQSKNLSFCSKIEIFL